MKLSIWALIFGLSACVSTQEQESVQKEYLRQVGDIPFDPEVDGSEFKVCDEGRALQYYVKGNGLNYKGEKIALVERVNRLYDSSDVPEESGYITIRFIVNCEGASGRFRVSAMNSNYESVWFDKKITNQLLAITESLDGWEILSGGGHSFDYYQYLTFKIEDGKISEIMP